MNETGSPCKKEHWHIDKKISAGHLISALIVAGSMFIWTLTVSHRVNENEKDISALQGRFESLRLEMKSDFKSVHDKLDRLIERQAGK